jgi:hypothetical protein
MAGPIHYEVYVRRTAPAAWALLIATEDRKTALETAEEQFQAKQAVAVRVTKETLDPETMEFNSLTILNLGLPEEKSKKKPEAAARPACSSPKELYAPHARALIGRVLEDWLKRHGVTAFELLHRPDLAERLDASGVELQHAVQKVAVPESQASGQDLHGMVRHYQRLADATISQLMKAGRSGQFPSLDDLSIADVAHRLSGSADRAFIMGGVAAQALADRQGARARLDRLMDLMDGAPTEGPPRALVVSVVEQIATEMLAIRSNLADILGPSLDLGASLAALVRMVAPKEVERLIAVDPRMGLLTPTVDGPAARLGSRIAAGDFPRLSAALARFITRELSSSRRLRPADPAGEIDILRTLAMALTSASGRLLTLEEVQNAFVDRSRSLVTPDFVASYVQSCATVLAEAEHLTRLCENVTGAANKRAAARWLSGCVKSVRLEAELRQSTPGGSNASQKLLTLARLQRSVRAVQLGEIDEREIAASIGTLGGTLEADAGLISQIARASAAVTQKLGVLLRMAAGETAPLGPAADRARTEALRMLRASEVKEALSVEPEASAALNALMPAAGIRL